MYSWTANMKDGRTLFEDINNIKDVLDGGVDLFHLTDKEHNIAVSLTDGIFYINTFAFDTGIRADQYRLIYFRRQRMSYTTGRGESVPQHIHRYLIGWQATVNGENIQRIFFIDPETHTIELQTKR
jgi:hypothetical protein